MAAWNLPPALHNLSLLVGAAALLFGTLAVLHDAHLSLPARLALWHITAVAAIIAAASATSRCAFSCRRLFGKDEITGAISWPCVLLFWPYHAAQRFIHLGYRYSSGEELWSKVTDQLYLGGWPLHLAALPCANCALLDVSAELLRHVSVPAYKPLLVLESWGPAPKELQAAVDWALRQQAAGHVVYCHCTHGHGRSAIVAAAVLVGMGGAADVKEALKMVVIARPGALPNSRQVQQLEEWAAWAQV